LTLRALNPADRQCPHVGSPRASRTARCAPGCSSWPPGPTCTRISLAASGPHPSCPFPARR